MNSNIIDGKIKSYLVACLVTGIDVKINPTVLMPELVAHLNSTERIFDAEGDEDGIILHNKNDIPILYIKFNGERLTFTAFEMDEFTAFETQKEIGQALLNIVGFLQANGYEHMPSVLGSEAHVVRIANQRELEDTKPEDWIL